uniref:Uncharacterized protein n=1 Tax=Meleagris gallopavo TaxID=9103 RepID=A0A803XU40_MELGA
MPLKPFAYPLPETRFLHAGGVVYKFKIRYGNLALINHLSVSKGVVVTGLRNEREGTSQKLGLFWQKEILLFVLFFFFLSKLSGFRLGSRWQKKRSVDLKLGLKLYALLLSTSDKMLVFLYINKQSQRIC